MQSKSKALEPPHSGEAPPLKVSFQVISRTLQLMEESDCRVRLDSTGNGCNHNSKSLSISLPKPAGIWRMMN